MIVIDASAMVEALVGRDVSSELLDAMAGEVHAPSLLDVEVLSVLRVLLLGGRIANATADEARLTYFALSVTRHDIGPLAERIWHLRHQYTAYDSCYLALAEALEAPLYTSDAELDSGGHSTRVHLLGRRG